MTRQDPLTPGEFPEFFREVHGENGKKVDPFPWQERLARHVFENGWPPALDVPTGAGKTAAIDIAVFHLALEIDLALDSSRAAQRRAARRVLFVVDRRLVVDDAFRRAERLAEKIEKGEGPVLRKVRARLALLAEEAEGRPLQAVRLRGGTPREPEWIRVPSQPAVVVSTVDQVGSRFFFRGYGVSDSMKPVHAGIVGNDVLLLLDEAHLSRPFVESLRAARELRKPGGREAVKGLEAPCEIVTLSATQVDQDQAPPLVASDDHEHPVLGPRLKCAKPASLVELKAAPGEREWTQECAAQGLKHSALHGGPASVVAIVVNRVRRARAVFAEVRKQLKALPQGLEQADVALLIGRSRPIERERKMGELLPRLAAANRQGSPPQKPLFVVATQCVEAGADLDFDALVTEVAPLDCLRQRFGRLNRMGRDIEVRAAVIASADQVSARAKPDPLYGEAPASTWKLLWDAATVSGKGKQKDKERVIDFGIEASASWLPSGAALESCLAPRRQAPVLMPSFLDLWARTSPVPACDPEVALFLHGAEAGAAEVQIAWRADLEDGKPKDWERRVLACPPSSLETLSVPFHEAMRWLLGQPAGNVSDVEGGDESSNVDRKGTGDHLALRWRGAERTWKLIRGRDLTPGDVIVVPAERGGCDEWGWSPGSSAPVEDVAYEAILRHRGRQILRLSPALVHAAADFERDPGGGEKARARFQDALKGMEDASDREVVERFQEAQLWPPSWRGHLSAFSGAWEVERDEDGHPMALVRRLSKAERAKPRDGGGSLEAARAGEAITEDDRSSIGRRCPVFLDEHSKGVERRAGALARQCGLPEKVCADIELAGYLHDAGKAQPSFKCWLYGGDELAAAISVRPLAKSGRLSLGRSARDRAGLPDRARHEVASLSFAMAHPRLREAEDRDLVLWLIGTHHGFGRPFFPAVDWPPRGEELSADLGDGSSTATSPGLPELTALWSDLRARLVARYGHWGLARLEAILRLADHRQSEEEQEEGTP